MEWVWGPLSRVDYGYQWIKSYEESNSAARLKMNSQENVYAETGLGMRVCRTFQWNGWRWIPELRLLGSHQWEKQSDIKARFSVGGDSFKVTPEDSGREMIIPGMGIQILFDENLSLMFEYEARVNFDSNTQLINIGISSHF